MTALEPFPELDARRGLTSRASVKLQEWVQGWLKNLSPRRNVLYQAAVLEGLAESSHETEILQAVRETVDGKFSTSKFRELQQRYAWTLASSQLPTTMYGLFLTAHAVAQGGLISPRVTWLVHGAGETGAVYPLLSRMEEYARMFYRDGRGCPVEWRTEQAVGLARAAYERDRGVLPVLADALEEAGCQDGYVLDLYRNRVEEWAPGEPVVDYLLGHRLYA